MKPLVAALVLLVALTACIIHDREGQPQFSGAVPPLYLRWGNDSEPVRHNVVIPFAYFNDTGSALYTPLFGWSNTGDFGYYLTPLAGWWRNPGVTTNWFTLFKWRCVNTDSHPEATSFDGGILPLFNIETPTVNAKGERVYDYGVFDLVNVWRNHRREFTDGRFTSLNRINSYAFYSLERNHLADSVNGVTASNSMENLLFLWMSSAKTLNIPSPTGLKTHLVSNDFIFPFIRIDAEFGDKLHVDSAHAYFEKVDNAGTAIFPFYTYTRRYNEFAHDNGLMTSGPLFLWTTHRNDYTKREFDTALWLFSREATPLNTEYSFGYGLFSIRSGEDPRTRLFWCTLSGGDAKPDSAPVTSTP